MDNILITDEMAVDIVVEQLKNGDFSSAEKIHKLSNEGHKDAIELERKINTNIIGHLNNNRWHSKYL